MYTTQISKHTHAHKYVHHTHSYTHKHLQQTQKCRAHTHINKHTHTHTNMYITHTHTLPNIFNKHTQTLKCREHTHINKHTLSHKHVHHKHTHTLTNICNTNLYTQLNKHTRTPPTDTLALCTSMCHTQTHKNKFTRRILNTPSHTLSLSRRHTYKAHSHSHFLSHTHTNTHPPTHRQDCFQTVTEILGRFQFWVALWISALILCGSELELEINAFRNRVDAR